MESFGCLADRIAADAELAEVTSRADVDGDGEIDYEEFAGMLADLLGERESGGEGGREFKMASPKKGGGWGGGSGGKEAYHADGDALADILGNRRPSDQSQIVVDPPIRSRQATPTSDGRAEPPLESAIVDSLALMRPSGVDSGGAPCQRVRLRFLRGGARPSHQLRRA